MDGRDKNWWMFPRWADEYENEVDKYVENAFASEAQRDEIRCPCNKCCYRYWFKGNVVKDHVISKGFIPLSKNQLDSRRNAELNGQDADIYINDDMDGLLRDASKEGPNIEAERFYKLVNEGQQELYPRCKNFTKLSFIIRRFVYKCDNKLSNVAFVELLELLKAMQADAKLHSSFSEANNTLKVLGLDYTKIDACPNDCMLYWEDNLDATSCHVCKASRWKTNDKKTNQRKIPAKVLSFIPIKKRLQRLFMCSKTAQLMSWHSSDRPKDGLLRHPADGQSWKNFDALFPQFGNNPRNVRLALSTDGFNPFSTMSIAHNTWPVMLINYSLPPRLCMKPKFIMLTLLIRSPHSPGNDIDVYLQPLIEDLKELWEIGVETNDSSSNQMFDMHVALLTTISDLLAYAILSGWSTKGKMACPCCHYETRSQYLTKSRKTCYMGHPRFLHVNHPYRNLGRQIDGENEDETAPILLSGVEVADLLSHYQNQFGKERPKRGQK